MYLKKTAIMVFLILSACPLWAGSATLTPARDETVYHGSHFESGFEIQPWLSVERNTSSMIQFQFKRPPAINEAVLNLDVEEALSNPFTIYVWGVRDGSDLEDFILNQNEHWPLADEDEGTAYTHDLYDADSDVFGAQALGAFTVSSSDRNQTVAFTSSAMLDFFQADTNGTATLILTSPRGWATFARTGHDTLLPPRLFLSAPDQEYLPSDDTYVRYKRSDTFGHREYIHAKLSGGGTGSTTRIGLISFEIDEGMAVKDAQLQLDVAVMNNGNQANFYVWGIKEGSSAEELDEDNANWWRYSSFFDGSLDGVDNSPFDFYNDGAALGTFRIDSNDLNQTVSFKSEALTDLINDDSNGVITLALTRVENNGQLNTGFASKEHPTLAPPRLNLRPELAEGLITPEMEIVLMDVDGDNENDLVLVANNPDGGGFATADPFTIADYFIRIGYGLGQGTDFFDALSSSQKYSFTNAYFTVSVNTCVDSYNTQAIASDAVYELFNSLTEGREYQISTFTDRFTLEADVNSGGLSLKVALEPCRLLEITAGDFTASIDGPSAQAVLAVSEDRVTVGAEYSYFTATADLSNDSGSQAAISYGQGGGIFLDVATGGDGQYGASFPFYGNTQVSLYISADDAETIYHDVKNAENQWHGEVEDLIGTEVYNILNLENASLISQVDSAKDKVMFVKQVNDEATIFVRDAGKEALVVLQNPEVSLNQALEDITQTSGNAAAALTDFADDFSNSVSATWGDVTGWVEGTVASISQGIKNLFGW